MFKFISIFIPNYFFYFLYIILLISKVFFHGNISYSKSYNTYIPHLTAASPCFAQFSIMAKTAEKEYLLHIQCCAIMWTRLEQTIYSMYSRPPDQLYPIHQIQYISPPDPAAAIHQNHPMHHQVPKRTNFGGFFYAAVILVDYPSAYIYGKMFVFIW